MAKLPHDLEAGLILQPAGLVRKEVLFEVHRLIFRPGCSQILSSVSDDFADGLIAALFGFILLREFVAELVALQAVAIEVGEGFRS